MLSNLIDHTPSAYSYPLLIKQLLHTPLAVAPEQEIVYRDRIRYNYWTLRHRIGQLASGLSALGAKRGDTVAMMDWDSHRYLESYFAVPMMGAVLMTRERSVGARTDRLHPQQFRRQCTARQCRFFPVLAAGRAGRRREQNFGPDCGDLCGDRLASEEQIEWLHGGRTHRRPIGDRRRGAVGRQHRDDVARPTPLRRSHREAEPSRLRKRRRW
jgi:hypothetical protein